MIREEMKIGRKGQVVIPKMFRKAMSIVPGSKVIFELREEGILIIKPTLKTEKVFEKIAKAKAGKTVEYLHPHEAYEGELEERFEETRR
ncbi:MAG: AbrB/MazE/SpoVT family DNA-binding domain-containing protein [Methanophagales archaeon]|nr:AbrB/MazE/SpoVT family DNA-binding domain-containing protein [Methanophagales archaeon]